MCSGIEAASQAWHPLGWSAHAFAEVDAFPSAVLAHHYPTVPNYGDMTTFKDWPDAALDLLVGGTPCQSFSVAGLRAGLDDPRGSLMLVYLAIARRYRPRWVVWENVPGVLSADDGRAFGSLLGGLAELGYGFAYRVLDAQHFGLAQRRKRVFVVGHLGDWRRAAAVLFERASLSGHPAPRRETRQVAPTIPSRRTGGGGLGTDWDCDGGVIASEVAPTLNAAFGKNLGLENQHIDGGCGLFVAHALRASGFDASEDGSGRGTPLVPVEFDWQSGGDARGLDPKETAQLQRCQVPAVVFGENMRGECVESDIARALQVGGGKPGQGYPATRIGSSVRRLTPRECERLQGFPDDYTLIPYRGKPASDGPRYKALGNSMAVPVMRWIGQRIATVDTL